MLQMLSIARLVALFCCLTVFAAAMPDGEWIPASAALVVGVVVCGLEFLLNLQLKLLAWYVQRLV